MLNDLRRGCALPSVTVLGIALLALLLGFGLGLDHIGFDERRGRLSRVNLNSIAQAEAREQVAAEVTAALKKARGKKEQQCRPLGTVITRACWLAGGILCENEPVYFCSDVAPDEIDCIGTGNKVI